LIKWLYYFISFLFTTPLWILIIIKSFNRRQSAFILWTVLAIGFIFSLFTPMFQYFRFLYLIPFVCLILNKNYFYTLVFLIFSFIYLLNPNFHREDWQSLSASLINPIYIIESVADPIKYYRPDLKINDLKSISSTESEITVIPYASEIHGLDYRQKLISQNYFLIKETSFRELKSETWQKLPIY